MKKIPLRVYLFILISVLLLVIGGALIFRLVTNYRFVQAYHNEEYLEKEEEKLLDFNYLERYIPDYNLGNAAYKKGDYNSAIAHYTEALKLNPPAEVEDCDVRINLALSYLNTIDFYSITTKDERDTALFVLYKARDILLENGCASNEGKGHDKDAQQLKEDIDRLIEILENAQEVPPPPQQQDNQNGEDNQDDNNSSQDDKPSDKEKKAQKELEENKKDAMEDRKDQQDSMEKYSDYVGGTPGEGSEGDGDESGIGSEGPKKPW